MRDISRRRFLESAGAGALAAGISGACPPRRASHSRPNILLIIDDQHSPRALGWTGQTQVRTPHLDRLAQTSVCFSNAYSASPVCAPARHSIYTGRYVSEHGVLHNDRPMRDIPTMIAMLNSTGYTTANVGKMHNAPYHHRRDFQYVYHHEFFDTAGGISHYAPFLDQQIRQRGLRPDMWWNPEPGRINWLEHVHCIAGTHWLPEDITPERWITDRCMDFLRDQLEERPHNPFFLHASYFPPHHPHGPIAKYAEMYRPDEMELPPNFSQEKLDRWCTGRSRPAHMDADDLRFIRARYFGFVSQLDAEVGRLLQGLRELGLADNTVVIFVSDHGDMIGEHGRLWKDNMFDGSERVPLMIRWPGAARPRVDSTPVSHVDLAPTLLRAAGLEPPGDLPGRDLVPLLAERGSWDDRTIYAEYFAEPASKLMVRRCSHKLFAITPYGQWSDFRYSLYDLEADPWELENLADQPKHKPVMEDLKAKMDEMWRRQRRHLPERIPPPMPRSRYEITWPADPWEPVQPA